MKTWQVTYDSPPRAPHSIVVSANNALTAAMKAGLMHGGYLGNFDITVYRDLRVLCVEELPNTTYRYRPLLAALELLDEADVELL